MKIDKMMKIVPYSLEAVEAHRVKHEALEEETKGPVAKKETVEAWIHFFGFITFITVVILVIFAITPSETNNYSFLVLFVEIAMVVILSHVCTEKEKISIPLENALKASKKMPEHRCFKTKIDHEEVMAAANAINNKQGKVSDYTLLAKCYSTGEWVSRNCDFSIVLFAKAADLGDMGAAMKVGNIFEHGQGIKPNEQVAYEWYQRARELGSLAATQKIMSMEYATITAEIKHKISVESESIKRKIEQKGGNASALGVGVLLGVAIS